MDGHDAWVRLGQGSLNGPTLFGRLSAFVGRASQAILHEIGARIQIYTDDPIVCLSAPDEKISEAVVILIVFWRTLGFSLATHKAQLASSVSWIGYDIEATGTGVTVSIKKAFLDDLLKDTEHFLKKNIIGIRLLRSYTGRANHIANLLFGWRPFLDTLWAAVSGEPEKIITKKRWNKRGKTRSRKSRAPPGTIWTKQVRSSLLWSNRFWTLQHGPLTRTWSVEEYFSNREAVAFYLDASPWGLGGVLVINGVLVAYFLSPLSAIDEAIHGYAIGDCKGQQTWECLAVLVALRIWKAQWTNKRCEVRIKSDNISALAMSSKMKIRASPLIAKEIALLYSEAAHEPRIFEHVPGVANVLADALSRIYEPGTDKKLPPQLSSAKKIQVPRRSRTWYKSLATG